MELINKNIGFAMTGSRRTTILIQLNYLRGLRTKWVQIVNFLLQLGAFWVHRFFCLGAFCKIFTSTGCIFGCIIFLLGCRPFYAFHHNYCSINYFICVQVRIIHAFLHIICSDGGFSSFGQGGCIF